jgi:hypothetical protein
MSDRAVLMKWVHRQNIERYLRIMKTELTPVERKFVEQRIAEEQADLRATEEFTKSPGLALSAARRP